MLYAVSVALSQNFAILITNPNQKAPGTESPEDHLLMMWDYYLSKIPAKNICFWAHCYGCKAVINLLNQKGEKAENRINSIAFVDSVSSNVKNREWGLKHIRHWILSEKPLNEKVITVAPRAQVVSGGTNVSAKINNLACESIFSFFGESLGIEKKSKKLVEPKKEKQQEKQQEQPLEINVEISGSEDEDDDEDLSEEQDELQDDE